MQVAAAAAAAVAVAVAAAAAAAVANVIGARRFQPDLLSPSVQVSQQQELALTKSTIKAIHAD